MRKLDLGSGLFYWLAIILILEMGLLHLITAQVAYEKAGYLGYLFASNFFGSLLAALGIYRKQRWGWILGLVIASGSILGYIWSRTLGLPRLNAEEWFSPFGISAMAVETAFVLIVVLWPRKTVANDWTPPASVRVAYATHAGAGLAVAVVALFATQWNALVVHSYGHHVGSLDQVCNTPVTSLADLEKNYGIRVSLVALSMLDGIVDVRIKVLDPTKAHAILQNQAALLVNQDTLLLAPHMHSHAGPRLKPGKIYTVFFPSRQKIRTGSAVDLVLGPVRVESVVVK